LSNPRDLFLQLLAEALWIERTLAFSVLPELEREADSELLATPLAEHLEETQRHVARVESVFVELGVEPVAAASEPLEGLRRQHDLLAGSFAEPRLKDLFLIDAATRTEALEAVLYESLIELAPAVPAETSPLEHNRDEELAARGGLERARRALLERLPV
jgi:ferritin-like metal-binding protein YciE